MVPTDGVDGVRTQQSALIHVWKGCEQNSLLQCTYAVWVWPFTCDVQCPVSLRRVFTMNLGCCDGHGQLWPQARQTNSHTIKSCRIKL